MSKKAGSLYRDVLLNTWATFVYFFAQWLLTIFITRLSGYDDAGTFTLAVSFSNIFGFISKFGMRGIQVGDINSEYSNGQYFTSRVITSIGSIVPFVIALVVCGYRKDLQDCCIAMMCYKLLEGFDDVAMGTLQRVYRYDIIAVSYTLKAVLTMAAMLALLMLGIDLVWCIWAMTVAYGCVLLFYDLYWLRGFDFLKWNTEGLKALYIKCVPLVITAILDAVLLYLPRNAIEQIYGSDELGYYGTVSIIVVVLSTLAGAVWGSILSKYSEIIQEKKWEEFKKLTLGIAIVLLVFGIMAVVFGKILGPFFFLILYGEEILNHMDYLLPVLLNAVLLLYNSFFICIFIPLNRRNMLMITDLAAVLICMFTVNYCTVQYGGLGACVCFTAALLIRFILLIVTAVVSVKAEIKGC